MSVQASMSLESGLALGPYQIVGLIGAGGMGEVYRARDTRLGRAVAVKIMRAGAMPNEDATRRLIAEARVAASISHPHVAQIYDIGERDGRPYVVMELVEGVSLEARLAAGPLPIPDVIAIGRALAGALAEAHRVRVIHRDIKPANIVITPTGQVKVLDFGIAKLAESEAGGEPLSAASTGIAVGTTSYMSPEQALGERITPASDVFSAGVVLYRMVSGTLPFEGASMFQVIDRILHAEPPPLTRGDLAPELRRVIRQALEKRPEARYPDGAALEAALAAAAAGEAPRRDRIAIAILPFEDLSPARDNEYFSSGLAEEITAALSAIESLAVVPRMVTGRRLEANPDLRTLAADLDLDYLLQGSVRKAGDALRITAQLIDPTANAAVWAESYGGTLQNVFEFQEEVSRRIAEVLRLKLSPRETVTLGKRATLDAEAFDLYLKGRHHLDAGTKRDLDQALDLFRRALERDPRYAGAHAGAAAASAAYYEFYDRSRTWLDRAVESGLRALMYDATSSEAYAALALAYFNTGAVDESRAACQRAIELNPSNWIGHWTLGRIHYATGRTDEAIDVLRRVIALKPDFYAGYFTLRMVCQASGREDLYRPYQTPLIDEILPRYLEKHPDDARARNCYGVELSMAGRMDEGRAQAEQALAQAPDDPMVLYATACYRALFGDHDAALDSLQQAVDAGFANRSYIEQDPDLRSLREDPRYLAVVRG
jgi:serine/threonine protein kinase/Flp pilus assembly protein TadD